MAIPDENLYEYAVVRYVPRVDREEFINIGLVMMCKRRKWLRGEVRLNRERIAAFDPRADFDGLALQASVFMRDDVPHKDLPVEERYRWLTAVKSAVLQVSPSHPGISVPPGDDSEKAAPGPADGITILDREFNRLFSDLVE